MCDIYNGTSGNCEMFYGHSSRYTFTRSHFYQYNNVSAA